MGVIPLEIGAGAEERPARARLRLPFVRSPVLAPTRTLLLLACAAVAALAPDGWLRLVAALPVLLVVYAAGLRDGRADMALDAFLRGDEQAPVRSPRAGAREGDE
jgi:hypothetical protein